ncbi:MAG TPA: glycogen debranching N-terminal domain-containing protein, partial [Roseiflexaceae bacterium]|nr:glycogen debranching N-terminal domain-containing protein [Roseiflexaceae bacterium]
MSNLLIQLRPRADTLYVSHGYTSLATERDGFIVDSADHGLFVHETRMLSHYRWHIDGVPPQPVALSNVAQHTWMAYYIAPPPGSNNQSDSGSGQVPDAAQHTIELRLSRFAGDGLHEDVDVTNYTQRQVAFLLQLEAAADFADQAETRDGRQQHGTLTSQWRTAGAGAWELVFDYHAEHDYKQQGERGTAAIRRKLTLRFQNLTSPPVYEEGRVTFRVALEPHATWHACIDMIPWVDGRALAPLYSCRSFGGTHNHHDRLRDLFLDAATTFSAPESATLTSAVVGALEQAKHDLAALRLYDLDQGERAWTMAAGLPIYTALFGRDTLTASAQAGLAGTDMLRGTLYELARWQGNTTNDWRDEQPGRLLHEAHTGPLAALNYNPRGRYYGSLTTSSSYPVAVAELWHWTGDKQLIRPLIDPALRALRWLDEHADLDGDGFYEYQTRSSQGVKHQGWKDSGDSIVYEDGTQAEPPIATCEEQGFAYAAKLHMAEVLWWLGEAEVAKRLYDEAGELKRRFNVAFWMESEGFFALGLDPQKRQIRSIASNAGHCLASGIVDQVLAPQTAERLLAADLFSGWGVRTLSAQHPAYNPFSYHRGSVWPVEQGTFALGFLRYGLHDQVERISRALFDATGLFDLYRLPELFSGHARDDAHPFPAIYPRANWPQAWSSSAIFTLLQSLLGLYP